MINENKKGYVIHKVTEDTYYICRILNEYNSDEEATADLVKLLGKKITEEDLLEKYKEVDIL